MKPFSLPWIAFFLALPFLLNADWTRIGLAGKEVTALVCAKPYLETMLLAGTHEGVWRKSSSDTGYAPLRDVSPSEPGVFPLNIHSLCFADDFPRLWAGDDSGLAVYTFTSGLPPVWRRIAEIPATLVTDITGAGDTLFCCTAFEVYRSFDAGTTWSACSTRTFLPALGNMTSFTSLALFNGIAAGSKFLGAVNSWQGVMESLDYGIKWSDISNFPGLEKPLGQVFNLLAYAPRYGDRERLLASTDDGLRYFFKNDEDTGSWRAFEPDLPQVIPNALSVGYFTWSFLADVWAATDSGAYRLNRSDPLTWVRLSSQKALCLIPNRLNDPDRWYAGTDDGVWEYAETVPVLAQKKIRCADRVRHDKRYYSINGRLLKKNMGNSGIVVVKMGKKQTMHKLCTMPSQP
jgi:hypothetical protein